MKRLLVMLVLMLLVSGCADTDLIVPVRNVAIDWRKDIYSPSMMISWAIKWEELPDVVEISDAAVIATVTELTHAELTREFHDLYFTYQLEIGEVLFDTTKMLSNGGSIAMSSGEGALTLAELKPKLDYTGSVYIPKYQGEHPDSDWVLATQHDATPIEVGRTYLLFLDRNPEDAVWIENGHEFIWEIADDRLIRGDGLSKWYAEEYTLEEVRAVIAARTGRCDEIGEAAYIAEVKAREAAELAAAKVALRARMDAAAASRTGAVIPMRKRQIVHTIENDLFADDTLDERLTASEAVVIARMDAMTLAYGMDSLKIGYDMTVEA
ncbi:MAG: hypothetical protein IJF67_03340, partial [Clostridia bacterium]|nr:hypothetical protein [Clostridia bacterium]